MAELNSIYPLEGVEMETAWAGTFAQTEDGLPYVGALEKYPGCYFALGYGGNGITFSLIAAQIIRDAILGRPNRSAVCFRSIGDAASFIPAAGQEAACRNEGHSGGFGHGRVLPGQGNDALSAGLEAQA